MCLWAHSTLRRLSCDCAQRLLRPAASAAVRTRSRTPSQTSALGELALEGGNKKIENFLEKNNKWFVDLGRSTRRHLSLFTRRVLPPNQDQISRSWPAGSFITATRAAWCLWWYMPVGVSLFLIITLALQTIIYEVFTLLKLPVVTSCWEQTRNSSACSLTADVIRLHTNTVNLQSSNMHFKPSLQTQAVWHTETQRKEGRSHSFALCELQLCFRWSDGQSTGQFRENQSVKVVYKTKLLNILWTFATFLCFI